MGTEKTYAAMIAEELCAQFVPNTEKYRFGNGKNGLCRYNDNVNCEDGYCARCGWNPSENRRRVRRIREERERHRAYLGEDY